MRSLFSFCFVLITFSCFSQNNFPVRGSAVKVRDWGSRSLIILDDFFNQTKDSIIFQIGEEEFEQVKLKCTMAGWPDGFYLSDPGDEEDKAFDSTLNKLNMFRIAAYTHIYKGKTFDRYVILRIPYEQNRDWNPQVKWVGNIYFLLKEKDLAD